MADMNTPDGAMGATPPADKAQEIGAAAAKTTDAALASVGESLHALAGAIRQSVPPEGVLGSAATTVADRLELGGRYLAHHGVNGITEDLSTLIRKHPLPAVGLALGIGWLLGAYTRKR
jgi:ElaB/YqjD/DUF883 family membrane-anchored ribosome-binding protein